MTGLLIKGVLQLVLLFLVSPLVSGVIKTLKAKLQTRRGPSIWQPYRDMSKLLRKGMVIPDTASWIFTATPYIVFATAALVGLMIPMTTTEAPLSLFGGVLAVVYLLLACLVFARVYRFAIRGGLIARYSAETVT